MTGPERRSALATSMLFCLGEWAMELGPSVLLQSFQGKPLLLTLFTVLDNIMQNKVTRDTQDSAKCYQHDTDDFDPDISLDNLTDDSALKSPRRGNVQAVQLAARMVNIESKNRVFMID